MDELSLAASRFRSFVGFLVWVVASAYYLLRMDIVLGDPDIWWHVQSGLNMLSTWTFPTTDTFSYTFTGQPWIAKEWLSQVILAAVYGSFGWNGVAFITVASAGLAVALVYREMSRSITPPLSALIALVIAVLLTQVIIARPHVFTLPLAVIFTARAFRAAEERTAPPFWLLGLITLWANLHGSFMLGFAIAALAFVHLVIETRLSRPGLLAKWVVFGLLCPVAALINPYGWTPYLIGFSMMAVNETMPLITEWKPFNASDEPLVHIGFMASLVALIGLRARHGWGRIIFMMFVMHMFLTHIRFIYAYFLLVPVVAAEAIGAAYPAFSTQRWSSQPRDSGEAFVAKRHAALSAGIVAAAVLAFSLFGHFAPPARRSIDDALAFIKSENLASERVLNSYNLGGILIFNGIKDYIDGRAEQLFRGRFVTDYIASDTPGGEALLSKMLDDARATWTIFPNADVRNSMIAKIPGWQQAYKDQFVTIFTRHPQQ